MTSEDKIVRALFRAMEEGYNEHVDHPIDNEDFALALMLVIRYLHENDVLSPVAAGAVNSMVFSKYVRAKRFFKEYGKK